jgi:excisionase family DNA binding protein
MSYVVHMGEVLNAADRFGGPANPAFYTVAEAATLLRVTTKTIYRRMDAGVLPSHKTGGKRLIAAEDLHAYLGSARE